LPYVKKSVHRPYEELYDEESREIVAKAFKEDIEIFGYSF